MTRSGISTAPADCWHGGDLLRGWRVEKGWSREQACVHQGVSYPYLTAIELGRMPSIAMAIKLAEGYGHSPAELFGGEPGDGGQR